MRPFERKVAWRLQGVNGLWTTRPATLDLYSQVELNQALSRPSAIFDHQLNVRSTLPIVLPQAAGEMNGPPLRI